MKSLSRAIAVVATVVATVTGCGGSGSDDESRPGAATHSSTVKPAGGDTITADGFSYTVPEDWKESPQSTLLSLAFDSEPTKGFRSSVNVVSDDTIVGYHSEKLEKAVKKVLNNIKASDVTIRDRTEIDGEEAVHSAAVMDMNGNKYRIEQFGVEHDGRGYFVTVSFHPSIPEPERDEVSESILTTWKWDS
ncbi:PsbP-related protein [Aeromicrobium sp.]|uniref:PsbP-related protein n=1 Tax=Aeromicrobium sp. TaxID=1871063 RepID=UPI002FC96100